MTYELPTITDIDLREIVAQAEAEAVEDINLTQALINVSSELNLITSLVKFRKKIRNDAVPQGDEMYNGQNKTEILQKAIDGYAASPKLQIYWHVTSYCPSSTKVAPCNPYCRYDTKGSAGVNMRDQVNGITELVTREMVLKDIEFKIGPKEVEIIYLGGGTPSFVTRKSILAVKKKMEELGYKISSKTIVRIECWPTHVTKGLVEMLMEAWSPCRVEISVGGVGLNPNVIREFRGGYHTAEHTRKAIKTATTYRDKGLIRQVNVDQIYGFPTKVGKNSTALAVSNLQFARDYCNLSALRPDIVTAYDFEVGEDTIGLTKGELVDLYTQYRIVLAINEIHGRSQDPLGAGGNWNRLDQDMKDYTGVDFGHLEENGELSKMPPILALGASAGKRENGRVYSTISPDFRIDNYAMHEYVQSIEAEQLPVDWLRTQTFDNDGLATVHNLHGTGRVKMGIDPVIDSLIKTRQDCGVGVVKGNYYDTARTHRDLLQLELLKSQLVAHIRG